MGEIIFHVEISTEEMWLIIDIFPAHRILGGAKEIPEAHNTARNPLILPTFQQFSRIYKLKAQTWTRWRRRRRAAKKVSEHREETEKRKNNIKGGNRLDDYQ